MNNNDEHYKLRKHKLNGKWCFDIESKNLIYSDCDTHHGLQCNYVGGTPEHNRILLMCQNLVILAKQIDKLNNPQDYQ